MGRLLIGFVMLGSLLVLGGMSCQGSTPGPSPTGPTTVVSTGTRQISRADLKLEEVPYEDGVLIMSGTPYTIKVVSKKGEAKGDFIFSLNLDQEGTMMEEEHYRIDDAVFQYRGNATESFDPPLTLLNFSQKIPFQDTWKGTHKWGEKTLEASAEISAKSDPLNLSTGLVDDAVLIDVVLTITEPSGNKVTRTFKFWVAPNRGVLKRDFAAVSTREPAEEHPANAGPDEAHPS